LEERGRGTDFITGFTPTKNVFLVPHLKFYNTFFVEGEK